MVIHTPNHIMSQEPAPFSNYDHEAIVQKYLQLKEIYPFLSERKLLELTFSEIDPSLKNVKFGFDKDFNDINKIQGVDLVKVKKKQFPLKNGHWVTIKGHHIFIQDGKNPKETIKNFFNNLKKTHPERKAKTTTTTPIRRAKRKAPSKKEIKEKIKRNKMFLEAKYKYGPNIFHDAEDLKGLNLDKKIRVINTVPLSNKVKQNLKKINKMIKSLPKSVYDNINRFRICLSIYSDEPLSKYYDFILKTKTNDKNVQGQYYSDRKEISIGLKPGNSRKYYSPLSIEECLIHETGHSIYYDELNEFEKLKNRSLYKENLKSLKYLYASTDEEEFFAECHAKTVLEDEHFLDLLNVEARVFFNKIMDKYFSEHDFLEEDYKVKGHYRTLKSGRRVWVKEHERGGKKGLVEEKKEKTKNTPKIGDKPINKLEEMSEGLTSPRIEYLKRKLKYLDDGIKDINYIIKKYGNISKRNLNIFVHTLTGSKVSTVEEGIRRINEKKKEIIKEYKQEIERLKNLFHSKKALKKVEKTWGGTPKISPLFQINKDIDLNDHDVQNKIYISNYIMNKISPRFYKQLSMIKFFNEIHDDPQYPNIKNDTTGIFNRLSKEITIAMNTSFMFLQETLLHELAHSLYHTDLPLSIYYHSNKLYEKYKYELREEGLHAGKNASEFFAEVFTMGFLYSRKILTTFYSQKVRRAWDILDEKDQEFFMSLHEYYKTVKDFFEDFIQKIDKKFISKNNLIYVGNLKRV